MNRLLRTAGVTTSRNLLSRVTGRRRRSWTSDVSERIGDLMGRRRRRSNTGRLALQGLGAAAVALPLGLWVGRRLRGEDVTEETTNR